jgi:hypothetical protein
MAAKDKTPGSITKTADAMDDRINNISNVSRAINNMQRDVDQKISETREEVIKGSEVDAIHSSMNQTLGQLNNTIGALSSGVKTITVDTAKATKDAIQAYGRAISEDISFNKKSVVAMALARTSPIYGYFVAKFVESDVWKRAMSRMAQSVSRTMGAIVRPFKGRGAKESGIPKLKNGGYIQQGGMAQLHQGETVVPSGGGPVLQQLLEIQQKQLIYLRSVFGVVRYKEPGMWGKFVYNMGAPLRLINKFRKSVGVYSSSLSSSKQPLVNIAQNLATLYSSLMWRLDNMTNIMIANAVANRDLAMHTIGKGYPAIRGVRTRQLVRPRARKLLRLGMAAMPYAAGLIGAGMGGLGGAGLLGAGIGARMLTRKVKDVSLKRQEEMAAGKRKGLGFLGHLGLERGMYAGIEEEGFVSSKLRGLRQAWLPRRSELIGRRGGMPGTGIGGATRMSITNTPPTMLAELIAESIRKELGGRKGRRMPVWMARIPSSEQRKVWKKTLAIENKQSKELKKIKESSKSSKESSEKLVKEVKNIGFFMKLSRMFGFVGSIFSGLFKFIKLLASPLSLIKYLLTPAALAYIAGGIAGAFTGWKIGSWIDETFFKGDRERLNEYFDAMHKEIQEKQQERILTRVQSGADPNKPFAERLKDLGEAERVKALPGFGKLKDIREKSIKGSFLKKHIYKTPPDRWIPVINQAQQTYMLEHSMNYSMYSVDEINRMRQKFSHGNKFRSLSHTELYQANRESIVKYGTEREAAFLKYLQDHGTKLEVGEVGSMTEKTLVRAQKEKGKPVDLPKRKPLSMADKMRNARNALEIHIGETYGLNSTRASLIANRIFGSALKISKNSDYWSNAGNLISFGDSMMKSLIETTDPGYRKLLLEKMDSGLLRTHWEKIEPSLISEANVGSISKDSLAQNEASQEAAKNTAGVKDNTDAIKENTDAMKAEADKTRKTTVNVVNQQNMISQQNQNSSSVSGGGKGGWLESAHWSRREIEAGQLQ